MLKGATAFVTGGTGFIGGRLIEVLTSQYGMNVCALLRNANAGSGSYRAANAGAEFVYGDITDEAAMCAAVRNCDYVFHCAFGNSGDVQNDRRVTRLGTAAVARAAAESNVHSLVNLSTIVVFGDAPAKVDERFIPNQMWNWPYPHDKAAAEQAVLAEHARSGLRATTLRLGAIYGPWGGAFTIYPLDSLASGRVALIDDGLGLSNATYVDDVVQAMILSAARQVDDARMFIIRGPDRVTWRQFYEAYQAMLGGDSLTSMTLPQIRTELRRRRTQAMWRLGPCLVRALKQDADFRAVLSQAPFAERAKDFVRRRLMSVSTKAAAPRRAPAEMNTRPLQIPPEMMWGFYASKSDYQIDSARELLGYSPVFDLEKGMALTGAWARWAGLVPDVR